MPGARGPTLALVENPDILATVAHLPTGRPRLVVGFAAETDDVVAQAKAKLARKGCDWIVANDVSPATGIMGGPENKVTLISRDGAEDWPRMAKDEVARRLEDQGFVETAAGSWTRVAAIDSRQGKQLYPIVKALETLALEGALSVIDRAAVAEMSAINKQMASAVAGRL